MNPNMQIPNKFTNIRVILYIIFFYKKLRDEFPYYHSHTIACMSNEMDRKNPSQGIISKLILIIRVTKPKK